MHDRLETQNGDFWKDAGRKRLDCGKGMKFIQWMGVQDAKEN